MIETERLLLRGWEDADLEPYARTCADPEVMRYIGDGSILTPQQSEAQISRFVRHWEKRDFGLWAVEEGESGAFMGFVGLACLEDWTAGGDNTEVGWRLGREFWGRGFATEGATASLGHGFAELGLDGIVSIIQPGNLASRRVAEKANLVLRGEARWRDNDVVWYAAERSAWRAARNPIGRNPRI